MKLIAIALTLGVLAAPVAAQPSPPTDGSSTPAADVGADPAATAPAPATPAPESKTTTTVTVTTQPSDSIDNPVDNPLAAIDDVRQAKKQGWATAILVTLIALTAGFARASSKWPTAPVLKTINKNKTVILVVGCLGVCVTAAYNALALGGSWFAVLGAAVVAGVTFVNAQPNPPAGAGEVKA